MKREKIIQELVLIVLTLLPILYLAINWSALPESMPIHFDAQGNPNGYGSGMVYVFMPMGLYFVVPKPEWVFVPLMIILVVVPIVYSYVIYQKLEK